MKIRLFFFILLVSHRCLAAQSTGSVAGTVVDAKGQPVEYATVTLQRPDGTAVSAEATDAKGAFGFENIPFGVYTLAYGVVGGTRTTSAPITLSQQQPVAQFGPLSVGGNAPVRLEKVEVSARQETIYNAIDRKVYNVGKDIRSATGSASDLLQNVPSVQVDVEGEVSLRGDSNVLILVNGKSSALMGRNRAAALEQMPASRIARVEVITNPSAKYKPDGTAGIINLVLDREEAPGLVGSLRTSAGNDRRYNATLSASYQPGKFLVSGSASVRQDDRRRVGTEFRTRRDAGPSDPVTTERHNTDHARPRMGLGELGLDYKLGERTTLGVSGVFNTREVTRNARQSTLTRRADGSVASDFVRIGTGPETEEESEFRFQFQHEFPEEERELSIEIQRDRETEREDNRYHTIHRVAGRVDELERTEARNVQSDFEASVEYVHPFGDDAKFETGYSAEIEKSDLDFRASDFAPALNEWIIDPTISNRFIYRSTIHALYATYGRPIGRFGVLGGLRFEQTETRANQVTAGLADRNDYARLYPSLHLTYRLSDAHELLLSYSHRVNRPDADELNPYPQYQDPLNLHAGNPQLVPEDIHSIEAGYQYRKDDVTYLGSVYQRWRYDGVTEVTRFLDGGVLFTRPENLAHSRSMGVELGATTRLKDRLALNFSANFYRNEIDASNLGFSRRRAAWAWDAKLNANWDFSKAWIFQTTTSYTARRLTAQGERSPSWSMNFGVRHNFKNPRISAVLTVSDAFNTLRDRTRIDTPSLQAETSRRRSSRIVYLGLIYRFGKNGKKSDDEMQFDNAL